MKQRIVLLLVVISSFTFANEKQKKNSNYLPGGIICLNNDIVAVQIKNDEIINLQKEVKLIDLEGNKQTFKPNMISVFFYDTENGRMIFESHKNLGITAFRPKNGYFLCRLSNNIYPLYYFVEKKMTKIGVESKMVPMPSYIIKRDNNWFYYNESNFKDFAKNFSENTQLAKDLKNNKYTFEDFPEIFQRYCNSIH